MTITLLFTGISSNRIQLELKFRKYVWSISSYEFQIKNNHE